MAKKNNLKYTIIILIAAVILFLFFKPNLNFLGATICTDTVILRTNSEGTYGEGIWIAIDTNNDGILDPHGSGDSLPYSHLSLKNPPTPFKSIGKTPEGYDIIRISYDPTTAQGGLTTEGAIDHFLYVLIDNGDPNYYTTYIFLPEPSPAAAPEITLAQQAITDGTGNTVTENICTIEEEPIIETETPSIPQGGVCDAVPQLTCPDGSPATSATLTSPEGDPNCVWEPVCPVFCPQIAPTAPGWCADGTITPPVQDANGCWGPPKCTMPEPTTPTSGGGGGGGSSTQVSSGCPTGMIINPTTGKCNPTGNETTTPTNLTKKQIWPLIIIIIITLILYIKQTKRKKI